MYNYYLESNWEFREVILLLKPKPREKVLDIGCGNGDLCYLLKSKYNVIPKGIDVSVDTIKRAKEKYPDIEFVVGDITDCNVRETLGKEYDAITMVQVIEHFQNPKKALKICSDLLKKDGRIVLTTINKWAYLNKLMCFLIGKPFLFYQDPAHLIQFSPYSIYSILNGHGFKLEQIGTWSTIGAKKINSFFLGVTLYAVGKKGSKELKKCF